MKITKLLVSIIYFFVLTDIRSQNQGIFTGLLKNSVDSTGIPFARIKLTDTQKAVVADEKGRFSISIPPNLNTLRFEISFLGCHREVNYVPSNDTIQRIFVDCPPINISEMIIEGLTPAEIVKRAVARIPFNYMDSSYFSFSFYREYKKVNGKYRNLIEDQAVTLFQVTKSGNSLSSSEALANVHLRRSNRYKVENFEDDNFSNFMSQNPVYYLEKGSLNSRAFQYYLFKFDSITDEKNFIITYLSPDFSSEDHGINNIEGFTGESREMGRLTIDKQSFAIVKVERKSYRNKSYSYPKFNNFVLPDRKFTEEFVDGTLIAEYANINGKYYLTKLLHEYTNEFFRTQTYTKAYVLTESFEWYSDSVSRFIGEGLQSKFYAKPQLHNCIYKYSPSNWVLGSPDFYFTSRKQLYSDLERELPIDTQFRSNGN